MTLNVGNLWGTVRMVYPVLLQNRLRFHDKDFLQSLPEYISNPSVTGFMIEQAVLASIVLLNDLDIVPKYQRTMHAIFFEGDFPSFDTARNDLVFYVPKAFNFRNIDGIIVSIGQKGYTPARQ
jgi:hypothetical protein